jgi:hypothetical protein
LSGPDGVDSLAVLAPSGVFCWTSVFRGPTVGVTGTATQESRCAV